MMFVNGEYNEYDLEAARILDSFLPERIFDAHAHLYDASFAPNMTAAGAFALRKHCTIPEYLEDMRALLGNREIRLNIVTTPDASMACADSENRKASLDFLVSELSREDFSGNVGEVMVGPSDTVEDVENMLVHPSISGFKCYHLLAKTKPTPNAPIEDYLPESAWEVADKRGLVITLHMVRDKALSDPVNSEYIVRMAKKYPNAVLILAHAARSFAAWTAIEAVDTVSPLENVMFDFSAICESPAMFMIMKKCGVERCMWGSDYPISRLAGKAISLADGFYWINETDLARFAAGGELHSRKVGTENLMALREACLMLGLKEKDSEKLFYANAARLFAKYGY
jgi:glutamate-1-semialdehyde 2,1-aminomutase